MAKAKDLTGQRFGRLEVIELHPEPYISPGGKPVRRWKCRCDCEKEVIVLHSALTSKTGTRSCGCQRTETMRKISKPPNIKICVICGKEYPCPPSTNKNTCSDECSSAYHTRVKTGTKHPHSPAAKAAAKSRPRSEKQQAIIPILIVAGQNYPGNQRGPDNKEAISWVLRDPDGKIHEFRNLLHWAREHAEEYFDMPPTDHSAHNISCGFHSVKRSMLGKLKGKNGQPVGVSHYKGWSLLSWRDDKDFE